MPTERRSSHRFPIPDGQGGAILRAGKHEIPVCITNASRLGYAVACPANIKAKCGDLLELITKQERLAVRVAHVQSVGDQTIMGLAREDALADNPKRGFFAAVGDSTAALFIVAALIGGLLVGISRLTNPGDAWQQVRAAVRALVVSNR
jgi:hypothetical protein